MIMDGINEKLMAEHEDYIKLNERVDIAVELMARSEFFNKESLPRVLGTEKAVKLADDLRKADKERKARDLEKYSVVDVDAQVRQVQLPM